MTASESYQAKKALIDQYLERINNELRTHVARQEKDPRRWGYYGDLVLIELRMAEILGALDGLTTDECTRYQL